MADTLRRHDDSAALPRRRPSRNSGRSGYAQPVGWERDTDPPNPAGWLSLNE